MEETFFRNWYSPLDNPFGRPWLFFRRSNNHGN